MKRQDSEFWIKASQAWTELASQLEDHPDVCCVDIGYPQDTDATQQELALRIHVNKGNDDFPTEVGKIPVVVTRDDGKSS